MNAIQFTRMIKLDNQHDSTKSEQTSEKLEPNLRSKTKSTFLKSPLSNMFEGLF